MTNEDSNFRDESGGDPLGPSRLFDPDEVLAAIATALEKPPIGVVLLELLIKTDQVGGPIDDGQLWQSLQDRIAKETGPGDSVLKTGDQRMTIIKAGLQAPAEAEGFALRVHRGLRSPILVGEGRVTCQAAIGVAVSRSGDEAGPLVRFAKHALEDARMLGGDRVVAFDDQDRDLILP